MEQIVVDDAAVEVVAEVGDAVGVVVADVAAAFDGGPLQQPYYSEVVDDVVVVVAFDDDAEGTPEEHEQLNDVPLSSFRQHEDHCSP